MWNKVSVGSQGPVLNFPFLFLMEVSVPEGMAIVAHPNSPLGTAKPNQKEAHSDALPDVRICSLLGKHWES